MDIDPVAVGSTVIRTANAVVWVFLCVRIYRAHIPVIALVRTMIITVLVAGMCILALGSLTAFGFPREAARFIYTAFTAYSLIIAAAIITGTD